MPKRRSLADLSTTLESDLLSAKNEWSRRLLLRPAQAPTAFALRRGLVTTPTLQQNVIGVGVGEKLVDGRPAGIKALKFFVRVKFPVTEIPTRQVLPKQVDGLPVDVEEIGLVRALAAPSDPNPMPNPRARFRPAQPGCSVGFEDPGHELMMAGTFGAVVKRGSALYILSNNHVLADEDRLPAGAPIFQPGLLDGGKPASDRIATLAEAVKLCADDMNQVDAAIAQALKDSLVSKDILFIGPPRGKAGAKIDMIVHKFGRTTGYRAGRVTSTTTDIKVQYETGTFTFQNQIIIVGLNDKPFSDSGDSGSLILERTSQKAVGLLFAGSPTHTIANHLSQVLRALRVTLA